MRLLVIGAGGHAKVVVDAAEASGWEIAGIIGLTSDKHEVRGHAVSLGTDGIEADKFIVAIGDNWIRARYFDEYRKSGLQPATVVHPSAVIGSSVGIGAGTFIAAGVIVNVEAVIGENVILNTGCVVDHDVFVGDHSLIGPQASLCGESIVGTGVMFGAGATIKPATTVGAWSICGAGAVVVSDLPPGMLCVGVPAKPVRPVQE